MNSIRSLTACLCLACAWTASAFIINPYRFGSAPPVSTSYANTGGTGNRTSIITTAQSGTGVPFFSAASQLIDGTTGSSTAYWNSVPDGGWTSFDFGSAKVINEVKYYQGTTVSHGTWKWQGSSDNSSWSDVGSSFTLGGSTTQTITEVSGNTTSYRYYRITKVSGTSSNATYAHEFEFKISA